MSRLPDFRLDGQRALVTGASSGLGLHFAHVLAAAGAEVQLAARRKDRLDGAVQALRDAGHQASALALDVCDATSVNTLMDSLATAGQLPDVVVHCAGVAVSKPLLEQTEADWDQVLDTNLKGAWLVGQTWARHRVAAGLGGSLVNIASITGERVAGGVAPYASSKAGLLHLTRQMALDVAAAGGADAVAFGRPFISNPDLGRRLRENAPIAPINPGTVYLSDATGYTDYPTLDEAAALAK